MCESVMAKGKSRTAFQATGCRCLHAVLAGERRQWPCSLTRSSTSTAPAGTKTTAT